MLNFIFFGYQVRVFTLVVFMVSICPFCFISTVMAFGCGNADVSYNGPPYVDDNVCGVDSERKAKMEFFKGIKKHTKKIKKSDLESQCLLENCSSPKSCNESKGYKCKEVRYKKYDVEPIAIFDAISCSESSEKDNCYSCSIDLSIVTIRCRCICRKSNLVELSKFSVIIQKNGVLLSWDTQTEIDSEGFRIWRAVPNLNNYCGCSSDINDYMQIQVLNEDGESILIPAEGSEVSGFEYSYLDKSAKPGIAYCYALEDIDSKGESKFYFEYVAFTPDGLLEE